MTHVFFGGRGGVYDKGNLKLDAGTGSNYKAKLAPYFVFGRLAKAYHYINLKKVLTINHDFLTSKNLE